MIILDGVPSTSDRQRVEGYLAHKWLLTGSLPADHPYKSTAPTNGGGGGGGGSTGYTGPRYSDSFVDNQMSALVNQYEGVAPTAGFAPFKMSVRGPSNLRSRSGVYKLTKE